MDAPISGARKLIGRRRADRAAWAAAGGLMVGTAIALPVAVLVPESPAWAPVLGMAVLALPAFRVLTLRRRAGQGADQRSVEAAESGNADSVFDHPLFRASPVGIARLDYTGKIIDYNHAFTDMLSFDGGYPDNRQFSDFVIEEERSAVQEALSSPVDAARPIAPEVTLDQMPRRIVSMHVGRLIDVDRPENSDWIVHLIDVTAFKNLENQILQSRKMQAIGQLAGGIAHDFNNLLTAMIGFCDLLLQRHGPDDPSHADLTQIKQNANRAASLVRQLLAFSRQQRLSPRVLSVTETLTELSHLLRRLIGPSVALKFLHGADLGLIEVDQGQFEQVVINLAVNARDAMPRGGTLTIRTQNTRIFEPLTFAHETMPSGDYVQLDVIDNGSGIPEEVMGKIFEPFFTTKPVGSGTGLGLSTVYGIVRQTNGFVTVKSELGRGTVFSIYLPRYAGTESLAPPEPVAEPEKQETQAPAHGTILLVEDEDAVRQFTARALRNNGYTVMEASSGEVAMETLGGYDGPLDLLITDAVMPVIDGPSLIKLVRERRPGIRVICVSGHTDEALRARLKEAGKVQFLSKPFSLKELAQMVKERLAED